MFKSMKVLTLPFFLSLAACTEAPTMAADTRPSVTLLPASQPFMEKGPRDGTLHILREYSFTGVACKNPININGQPVVKLAVKENITLFVPEGEVFVGTQHGCVGGSLVEERVEVEAGKSYFFRTGFSATSTNLRLFRSSPF